MRRLVFLIPFIMYGCAYLKHEPRLDDYLSKLPPKPEIKQFEPIDLSFLESKPDRPLRIFLSEDFKIVSPNEAYYIAYSVQEHDKIVERLSMCKKSDELLRMAVDNIKLKHDIIQNLEYEKWLLQKQVAIEQYQIDKERLEREKEITFYRLKDILYGIVSIVTIAIGLSSL